MDDYGVKFSAMQQYVPFLDKMIRKLEKCRDREKQAQLEKMRSLYGILTDPSKKVRFEVLVKCEEVLQKLYEKVEGTTDQDSGPGHRKSRSNTPRSPSPGPGPDRDRQGQFYHKEPPRFSRKVGLLGDAPPPHRGHPGRPGESWAGQRAPAARAAPPSQHFSQPWQQRPPWQHQHQPNQRMMHPRIPGGPFGRPDRRPGMFQERGGVRHRGAFSGYHRGGPSGPPGGFHDHQARNIQHFEGEGGGQGNQGN